MKNITFLMCFFYSFNNTYFLNKFKLLNYNKKQYNLIFKAKLCQLS